MTQDYVFGDFDCDNKDLNDFLLNDSKKYMDRRLAVTYIIESDIDIVGYFSVSNDKLTLRDVLPFYLKNSFKCLDCRQLSLDTQTVQLYYNLNELD